MGPGLIGAIPIVLMSSGWKRPRCGGFLFYGMVSGGCHQGKVKRSYAEVCDFPKQLFIVLFDRQVRVVFHNGADVCRRRFRKRDGHARTGGAACGSYCACVIVDLLLFLLCHRLVEGYIVVLVENSRALDGKITL